MDVLSPSLVEIDPSVKLRSVLPDRIFAVLKRRILTCDLLPGARLVEREVCATMDVSRTPLREALNRLIYEGLVVPMPYRGYAVAPLTIESIHELCEIRRINESEAAAMGAERMTDDDLAALDEVAEPRYTVGDHESLASYLRVNAAFHLAMVKCSGNRRLQSLIMAALDQLQRPEYLGLALGLKDSRQVGDEHREILEALRTRDAGRARAVMTEHISKAEERIIRTLQATEFWKTIGGNRGA